MKKIIFALLFSLFLLPTQTSYADWVDVSNVTAWKYIHDGKIILYELGGASGTGGQPLCIVETYRGTFYMNSDIRFIKKDLQDWDKIIVDGEVHDVTRIQRVN